MLWLVLIDSIGAAIAGMAFANAFLGICHSMAHQLGALFHIPHGLANALVFSHVIRFNATNSRMLFPCLPQLYSLTIFIHHIL